MKSPAPLDIGPSVIIARLRRENHALRDRVARLEEALGITVPVPAGFKCGPATTRARVWRFLVALAARGMLDADQARIVLYPDRKPMTGHAGLNNYAARVRAYLHRHGIAMKSQHGIGWTLDAQAQAEAQKLVERLSGRAAA